MLLMACVMSAACAAASKQPSLRTDKSRPHASRPTAVMGTFTLETDGVRLAGQQSIGRVQGMAASYGCQTLNSVGRPWDHFVHRTRGGSARRSYAQPGSTARVIGAAVIS